MTKQNQKFELEELTIQLTFEGDTAKIVWSGVCESQEPEVSIGPFLQGLLPSLEGSKVIIDFRICEYINSASITLLFQLIKQLNARQIDTEIFYSSEMEWQRITFRSVKVVTQTLPHIKVVGS